MRILILSPLIALACLQPAFADDVKREPGVVAAMSSVFDSYRRLQPYIYGDAGFSDPAKRAEAAALLDRLGEGFHSADVNSGKFSKDPAFKATVSDANDEMREARNLLRAGQSGLAQIRLKSAANFCISCHTSHAVDISFYDESADLSGMTSYQRGEYFLATRQFEKARSQFVEAIVGGKENFRRQLAMRGWLLITTRVSVNPSAALAELKEFEGKISPTQAEKELISKWRTSFENWSKEEEPLAADLKKADDLISRHAASLAVDPTGNQYEVEALRGTAILHRILDQKNGGAGKARARILYLLGLAYSGLKSFNIPELPRVFLEDCIESFPGTVEARKSFEVYSLTVVPRPGVQVSDEDRLRLDELKRKAFGEVEFKDRI